MSKMNVKGLEITVISHNDMDYISLTDMAKGEDGADHIRNWMRNRNTIEYLGLWETLNNPENFKGVEFDRLRKESGLNSFNMTPKKWVELTNGIGIFSKAGKNGGTLAHKDIAFHFGLWISAEFNLYLVSEFQRLKKDEADRLETGWDYRRFLAKTNYAIHTDAIKEHIIPELTEDQAKYAYANEADMLNVALFGMTAKQWQKQYPDDHSGGHNMRSFADVHQLIVLTNLESTNAFLVSQKVPQRDRLLHLRRMAIDQLKSLRKSNYSIDKIKSPYKHLEIAKKSNSGDEKFDATIDKLLGAKKSKN